MIATRVISLVILLSALCACGKSQWPPNEGELEQLFLEQREAFLEVEREMISDGLVEMSESIADGTNFKYLDPVQPELDAVLRSKYQELLGSNSRFHILRNDKSFSYLLEMSSTRDRSFLFWYVHDPGLSISQICDAASRKAECGGCTVILDEEWYMHWKWFPRNPTKAIADESCPADTSDILH